MRKYLTVHGYGQGVHWRCIYADSAQAIESIFKGLTIYENPPSFWTHKMEKRTDSHILGSPIKDKALFLLKRAVA